MAWSNPRTYTVGEIITKSILDTHVKDNLRYLKGTDGTVTLDSGLILPDGAGFYIHIPNLTTTQRDNLTPTAGMLIYNTTTTQFNKYENGAWRADLGFNSDHGLLGGLGDDDHTQYALRTILTTRGDIIFRNATVWDRLPKGSAGQYLIMGANDPAWSSVTPITFVELTGTEAHAVGAASAWTDWDISAIVPAGAKVVELLWSIASAVNSNVTLGARKNGSALSRTFASGAISPGRDVCGTILCEVTSQVVELYTTVDSGVTWGVKGYWA